MHARPAQTAGGGGVMVLDIRTTIMIAAALTLLIGISLRYALRDYPAVLWPSMRLWILGILLQPTGWVLYGARDLLPDLLTIVLSNTLLAVAFAKLVQAVHLFGQRPIRPVHLYAPVFAVAALELVFTYAEPSMRWRGVTVSLVLGLQLFGALRALLGWSPNRRSHLLTAAAFIALGATLVVRALLETVRPFVLSHALAATPMQTIVFSLAVLFPTIATLGFVLMCSDRLHQELERHATTDMLTGIGNRRTLEELATRAVAAAHRHRRALALLLIDADHFKQINDDYGHEAGDAALKLIAAILRHESRDEDLLGRLGGEEFVIVLPEAAEAAAMAGAERLRHAIEQVEFVARAQRVPLRVSIGIATLLPGDDFAALLRRADRALYAAKRAGRNRVVGPHELPPLPDAATSR